MSYRESSPHDSKLSSSDRNNKPIICVEDIADNTCKPAIYSLSNLGIPIALCSNLKIRGVQMVELPIKVVTTITLSHSIRLWPSSSLFICTTHK